MNNLVQQSKEWLEFRQNKIGSSDAPVIMEVSPWKTQFQLWEEKIGVRKQYKTEAMQRGLELENKARSVFETKTNLCMLPEVINHPQFDWMIASLDGIDIGRKHIVEIKCAGSQDHSLAKEGKVPEKYYPQIQHQLEVCGLEMAYYFSFDGEDGVIVEVEKDQKYIDEMVVKEEEFWKRILDFSPPETSLRDYNIRSDDMWVKVCEEWKEVYSKLKELETKEKDLRESIIHLTNNQNTRGGGIQVSKVIRQGNVEYSKIPELQGINLNLYRKKPTEYWKIASV